MNSGKKIYYNVSVNNDGIGWIWLDKDKTKTNLYKVEKSSIKVYCDPNRDETENYILDRSGTITIKQIGDDCSLENTITVYQSGGAITYSISQTTNENFAVYEATTHNSKYVVNSIDTTDIQLVAEYSVELAVTKEIGGRSTANVENISINLNSINNPQYFSWQNPTSTGATRLNDTGKYRVVGGGNWNIKASLNNNAVNYINQLSKGFTPSATTGTCHVTQSGGTIYTLTLPTLRPCERTLNIEYRKNNDLITDYEVTWRKGNTSVTGNTLSIEPNYTTSNVQYRVGVSDGTNTMSGTTTQSKNATNSPAYVFYSTAPASITYPASGSSGNTIIFSSYYDDECSQENVPIELSGYILLGQEMISGMTITSSDTSPTIYTMTYDINGYNDINDAREGEIRLVQNKSGKVIKVSIIQNPVSTVFDSFPYEDNIIPLTASGCDTSIENPTYNIKRSTIISGQTTKEEIISETYDGTLEFGINDSGEEIIHSADTWVVTAATSAGTDTAKFVVTQSSITEDDYVFGDIEYFDGNDNKINSLMNLPKSGGTFKISIDGYRCDVSYSGITYDSGASDICDTKPYRKNWLTYDGVVDGKHVFEYIPAAANFCGDMWATLYFKFSGEAAKGKNIGISILQKGNACTNGLTPACQDFVDCVVISKQTTSETFNMGDTVVTTTTFYIQNNCDTKLNIKCLKTTYDGDVFEETFNNIEPNEQIVCGGGSYVVNRGEVHTESYSGYKSIRIIEVSVSDE